MKQLSLIDTFETLASRDQKLIDELKSHIGNLKYLRINTGYSEFDNRDDIIKTVNQILYWIAFLAWKKSRYLVDREDWKLDNFLSWTKDRSGLSVTIPLTNDDLRAGYFNTHKRIKTTVMAYRAILSDEVGTTKRILEYFNELHNLTE